MSGLSSEHIHLIADRYRRAVEAGQGGLYRCVRPGARFHCVSPRPLDLTEALRTPGVVVGVEAESTALAVLIPDTVLASEWKKTDVRNDQRWRSLAAELADQLLPEEFVVGRVQTMASADLAEALRDAEPAPDAVVLEVELTWRDGDTSSLSDTSGPASDGDTGARAARAENAHQPSERPEAGEPTDLSNEDPSGGTSGQPTDAGSAETCEADQSDLSSPSGPSPNRPSVDAESADVSVPPKSTSACSSASVYVVWPLRRFPAEPRPGYGDAPESAEAAGRAMSSHLDEIKQLPVQVIVQVARKKVPVSQLIELAPGSLLMFDKSYDEPLDLYVNNQLLARGEAVKIGEKFGLKIDEIPARIVREEKVIQL